MAEPTLVELFGTGATQDATELVIQKTDLQTAGLTPSASNTAESLFVALFKLAMAKLTQASQDANPEQSITIEESFDSIISRNNQTFRQKSLSVNLQKLDTSTTIDPDDY